MSAIFTGDGSIQRIIDDVRTFESAHGWDKVEFVLHTPYGSITAQTMAYSIPRNVLSLLDPDGGVHIIDADLVWQVEVRELRDKTKPGFTIGASATEVTE